VQLLRKGERYERHIIFEFSAEKGVELKIEN
jgi:hypothetical protein